MNVPPRSIRPLRPRRTSGRGRAARRRRRGRCRRGPRRLAVGRGARRRGRGIRSAPRATMSDLRVLVGKTPGGRVHQRYQGRRPRCAGRARGRHGARRARGSLRRTRRRRPAGARLSRSRSARPGHARGRASWKSARKQAEAGGLAVKGVTKSGGASASAGIGGMVLVTSHGFRGAILRSQPRDLDVGDRRRRHRHGDATTISPRRCMRPISKAPKDRPQRRRTRGQAAQSAQGRDPPGAGGVRSAGCRLAGRPSRQRHQRQRDRAQDQFPEGQARRAAFRARHRHHRRSAAQARPALAAVRWRRRRRAAR